MGNHHSHTSHTCPTIDRSGPPFQDIVGSLTWHSLSTIIAGVAGVFSILVATFLTFRHACHFSNPAEQKQIIRIVFIVPTFAVISFLCVWQDGSPAPYIAPGRDISEALPMGAFFLLMVTYLTPDERIRDQQFAKMPLVDKKGAALGGGSLTWFRKLEFGVLQYIPISIILWIATAISLAEGTYCINSNSVHFAKIWITIIRTISTFLAIASILKFYHRAKATVKPRGAFKQLICFKLIVFLNFLQTLIFSLLVSKGDLHATKYMTYNDLANGLPALILSCELAVISPVFLKAFSATPYKLGQISSPENPSSRHEISHYQGGPLGIYAIAKAINVFDMVIELAKGAKANFNARAPQNSNYYNMQAQGTQSQYNAPQYDNRQQK